MIEHTKKKLIQKQKLRRIKADTAEVTQKVVLFEGELDAMQRTINQLKKGPTK